MIQSIRLQNFKGIRDVEVGLERLTVFVGPNGSGKTSILQGLELLAQSKVTMTYDFLNKFIFDCGYRNQFSSEELLALFCWTDCGEFRFQIKPSYQESLTNRSFSLSVPETQMAIKGRLKGNGDEWKYPLQIPSVTKSIGLARLFRFEPARMMEASAELGTTLRPDGYGLASTLALLALNQPEIFAALQREFKDIMPFVEGIRFDRFRSNVSQEGLDPSGSLKRELFPVTLDQILFDLKNSKTVTPRGVSEGTLLVLGLLSALHGWGLDKPTLVLLDDLDRGLHPLAQINIIKLLRKIMEKQPDVQIVATTHSPYLLDSLQPEEVRMTTLNEDGSVACGRLVDHPKFEQWKDEMAPGEMWSMFGEKWVSQSPAPTAETL